MQEAKNAIEKFKDQATRHGDEDWHISRQFANSGYQKSDLSDDQIFSESMGGGELSMDRRDLLENAMSSQHPSTSQLAYAAMASLR